MVEEAGQLSLHHPLIPLLQSLSIEHKRADWVRSRGGENLEAFQCCQEAEGSDRMSKKGVEMVVEEKG